MKKILSFVISLLLVFSVLSVSALSPIPPYDCGDTDMSRKVTISDATLIQKHVAKLQELSKLQLFIADVDGDDEVTVKDATEIQKFLAEIILYFENGNYGFDYLNLESFTADYDSNNAVTGDEVTFYAKGYSGNRCETEYAFYINGEMVQERSLINTMTCSFDEAGDYKIGVRMYDKYDITAYKEMNFTVAESRPSTDDSVWIKGFCRDYNAVEDFFYSFATTFTAYAAGGSGEYEYCFLMNGEVIQDFSKSNTCLSPEMVSYDDHIFTVIVKDCVTEETVSKDLLVPIHVIF